MKQKGAWQRVWHFIWEENSVWSWLVNVALAFLIIKFLVYPGLGLVLDTSHPVVAVVSGSMEHDADFDDWWQGNGDLYDAYNITKEDFAQYRFRDGFSRGDMMVLRGKEPQSIKKGDVLVFRASQPEPIIHRMIEKRIAGTRTLFTTKGDNNEHLGREEVDIPEENVVGVAWVRIPFLGFVKIWFVEIVAMLTGVLR